MNDFKEVYDGYTAKKITAAARKNILVFALTAALFIALCAAFCVLTAYDLVNAYLGCAVNVILTVSFSWYGYLLFKVYSADASARAKFLKRIENALPERLTGAFVSREKKDAVYDTVVFGGEEMLIDSECAFAFEEGALYDINAVDGRIISFRKAGEL